jgi:TolB-like protein/DNA-binding SARP family transcriptional activator
VIEPSAKPPVDGRYRLQTFGTFSLKGPGEETILGTHGHQHRRLALLSVLAAAGRSGRSRDQLLLLFWPDSTQSRARHSLEQLLYAIRGALSESVFAGVNPVRLNPDVITSDIAAFNEALERRDFEAAVEEYRGPFLDGFYLSDSPEFEQWLEGERARLARNHADALERLAGSAEAANNPAEAVRLWQKLVDADAVSSRNATGLIRALMRSGDRAAALRYAEKYQAIVAREFGSSGGPAIDKLVAEIRAGIAAGEVSMRSPAIAQAHSAPVLHVVPEENVEAMPSHRPDGRSRLSPPVIATVGVAVAALTIALAWPRSNMNEGGSKKAAAIRPSIAVLPLANVARGSEDAAFVDGLSEELMAALSRIDNLRVIARTSAFAFKDSKLGVRAIADSLDVSNILEGSVQRSGARFRVQVRLVDASDGTTRWSETFDREVVDVFAVQSEIASAIARELHLRLSAASTQQLRRGPTRSIAAYDLFLRGRDPINFRFSSDSGRLAALGYLQQAVALDPTFALAYAHMPYWYGSIATNVHADSLSKMYRLADSVARIAIRLDSTLPDAHVAIGISQFILSPDFELAEIEFRRAIALGGSPRAREHLANVLLWMGRPAEALIENQRAAADDPMSASAAADLGRTLCFNGRYAEGMALLAGVSKVQPPLRRTTLHMGFCHAMQGAWKEAAATTRDAPDQRGRGFLGYYLARAGDTAGARKVQAGLIDYWRKRGRGAMPVAIVAAGLGDHDTALEWIGRSGVDQATRADIMFPLFDDLRRDPRFATVARRIGLYSR